MSPAKKKTKAAKSTARKAPARATAAGKKPATKPSTAKAAKPTAAKTTKPSTTRAAKPKALKTTKPRAAKAKTTKAPAAAAKARTAAPAPKQAAPRKRAPSRRNRKKPVHAPASEVLPQRTPVAGEPRSKLGSKWECFSCGAKFYDLNKPEPLCPRCGANQLDEDAMVVNTEELDLGVPGVDETVADFIGAGESEEDSVDEEDEEP
jgi:rubrerythrin